MTELDDLGKKFAKSKKGDMGSAVEGTEAIREWVSMTLEKGNLFVVSVVALGDVFRFGSFIKK